MTSRPERRRAGPTARASCPLPCLLTRLSCLLALLPCLVGPAVAQPVGERSAPLVTAPDLYLPERFEPRGGGESFLSIAVPDRDKAAIGGGDLHPVMGFRLMGNISRNAFTPVTADGASVDVVGWRYVTEPVIDLRLPVGTVIAAGLPIVVQRGRVEPTAPFYEGDALGDGWLELTHAWQVQRGYLGGTARLTVPTGNEDLAFGNGAARLLTELIAGHPIGNGLLVAGSLGYRRAFRARSDRAAGDEVVYRLGARLRAWQRRLHVETAFVGAVGVDGPVDDRIPTSNLPLEWLFGVRWPVFSPAAMVRIGMGFGLDRGEGMPLARFLVGLDVACALGECLSPGGPLPDGDGDGVPDFDDACPGQAEDLDDFADADGCPEIDNDLDGVPDDRDKCPDRAEDTDGFDDADGCPDPDNDRDSIPDTVDRCPDTAEDKDGYQDTDGCPEEDDDGDGIADVFDLCDRVESDMMVQIRTRFLDSLERQHPSKKAFVTQRLHDSMEDLDGFEDDDGCPDYDHDRDGVPEWDDRCPDQRGPVENNGCPYVTGDDRDADGLGDLLDRCPDDKETVNGFVDGDGCPDGPFSVDFQRYFKVHDDGRVTLEQPLDPPVDPGALDAIQRRAVASPDYVDGAGEHRDRVARALAHMLVRINDEQIHLELRAGAGPAHGIRAFVEAITTQGRAVTTDKKLAGRLIPMCRLALPDGESIALQLCLPPRANTQRRRGLPQNLPVCPSPEEQEAHACPP